MKPSIITVGTAAVFRARRGLSTSDACTSFASSPTVCLDWTPPPISFVKINCDANIMANGHLADCLEALNLIHLTDISPTVDHYDLLSDIKALSNRDWTIHVTLIQRSANNAADLLAKCAARNQNDYFIWNQPSNDLMVLLQQEQSLANF
ncbi:hypothetical protein PIB30_093823 [Stylosanthes scabra]|uniref:RNase H type-1 domain-containing protein n=1 Tax=Stylosanthes scabra TaxID=79078 RepID=A0ABU6UXR7_9FABA|nr:hypothetical protein [Stylosanthes scabra]